jgi:hypothetical protein
MLALEYILIGALSALGWWGSNHYIIEPYFPDPIPKVSKTVEKNTADDVK